QKVLDIHIDTMKACLSSVSSKKTDREELRRLQFLDVFISLADEITIEDYDYYIELSKNYPEFFETIAWMMDSDGPARNRIFEIKDRYNDKFYQGEEEQFAYHLLTGFYNEDEI
ncbi:MAG: hypothetical protein KC478_13080, partial [Bacteriovoracaceae bacterium]|nr:hypothetical protein [Bacteriovoracaceae bacterium]